MSVDMGSFIAPKSDQLNADDLIAAPRTITVTGVRANGSSAEQPVSISFEGDGGKPYMPCKSMRRVMVCAWGADAAAYVGRAMTLYRDESVQFGGMKVGGIRISHMSHLEAAMTIALTATRARRAPFTVQPLSRTATESTPTVADYETCTDLRALELLEQRRREGWRKVPTDQKPLLKAASDAATARLASPQPAAVDDEFTRGYDKGAAE